MQPVVISVQERNIVGANLVITTALVVSYKVGELGPFTLVTTQTDLQSGKALTQMQQFAATLGTLPYAQPTS